MDARQASPRGAASTNRYSCAVCLEAHAIEPVVTACGHLYCWQCLYRWLDAGHNRCPVCSARVDRNEVTPLYASDERDGELEKLRGRPPPAPRR
ncbi:cAMP binding protein [Aureococcus anophagefferens]|nr:cAMP binding protein [Aureococcus anophagefferens]